MRDLAVIAKIQEIKPIDGKDRIELATVENYTVIVGKGEYKVGDLVVYVFYETVLPVRPEFEFLRGRCYNKLYGGFRIKAMKMGGVYSNGIIFPTSILPSEVKIKEGTNVEKYLGVVKYSPEDLEENKVQDLRSPLMKKLMRFKIIRNLVLREKYNNPYPGTVEKSDETNIQKLFDEYKEKHNDEVFYITEKVEGQSATYMLIGKTRKYRVYSHNRERNPKGSGNWETLGRTMKMKKLLKKQKKNYAIQGEIVGPGIQKNIYGFDALKLFVFKITETDTGRVLDYPELAEFCVKNNFKMVPVIAFTNGIPDTLEDCLKEADGKSVINEDVPREGLVYRSMNNQSVGFKARSREYAVWFENGK